ncbi:toll/interleukin-1 receptor domain-containing protein [Azohydromonas caseinilytica]|uniref:TIR domain-containing protein n=1 Tax=Azohydromonas caseinilytica TaxID=2728836 RepID=A0A848FGA2_9BURK|nr:TIR domain-containing protein [Azohydromonas caseinilytica]NML17170.1 TIR domain-containing protein [Azohydromonas caseinilytica]
MSRVFISYRRSDSAQAATRLCRHIGMRFGHDLVFQDVEDIKPGCNWLESIRQELASCEVFLVVIGPHWLVDADGRHRLADKEDVLRWEVCEALHRHATVLPVLVDDAHMPSSQCLPDELKSFALQQAMILPPKRWAAGIQRLMERVCDLIVPRATDMSLEQAQQMLYDLQMKSIDSLEHGRAADALALAQKSQSELDRALPLYPEDAILKVTRGYLYKNEAMALMRLERQGEAETALNQAENVFRTMLDERPKDASAWNGLGSVEAVRGHLEKAHEYIDEALKIAPDYPAALQDHEMILQHLGRASCHAPHAASKSHH